MLRKLSSRQFADLAYFDTHDSPEDRMDLRFALLASLIASTVGMRVRDGSSYNVLHYLRSLAELEEVLDSDTPQKPVEQPTRTQEQHVAYVTSHLDIWIRGANIALKERGVVH